MIGNIRPVGESNEDARRLENLKALCELVYKIHVEIDELAYDFKDNNEASIKSAVKVANNFLKKVTESN